MWLNYLKKNIIFVLFVTVPCIVASAEAKPPSANKWLYDTSLIEAELEWLQAERIVISATKSVRTYASAPSIVKVYTAADIRQMGFDKLSDIFWTLAGVQVHQALNNRQRMWFRGVKTQFNNKTALFINGIPQRDHFGGYPSDWQLPIRNIKKIEIIRGPGAALYGTNAFSGVINIYTYQPGDLANQGKIEAGVGNLGSKTVNMLVDKKMAWGHWLFDGNFYDTDGQQYSESRTGETITKSAAQRTENIDVTAGFLNNQIIAHVGHKSFANLHVRKGDLRPSLRDYDTWSADVRYHYEFEHSGAKLAIKAYYNEPVRDELESRLNEDGSLIRSEQFVEGVTLMGADALLNYPLSTNNELIVGVDIQHEKLTDNDVIFNMLNESVVDSFSHRPEFRHIALSNYALYLQDTHQFNQDKTTLTLGLRADFQELFGDQLNGRIGLVNQFNQHIFAKALYGTAFRAPSFVEFVRVPVDPNVPNLTDVEKMRTFELQIGYRGQQNLHTLTYFHNNYKGFIDNIDECFADPSQNPSDPRGCGIFAAIFGNTGNRKMQGIEFENDWAVSDNMKLFFNLSYLHTEDSRTQDEIPLLANWTSSFGFNWQRQWGIGKLSLNSYVYVYGDRKDWDSRYVTHREQTPGQRQASFGDGFAIWNGKVGYAFNQGTSSKVNIEFSVKNILDKTYYNQDLVGHNSRFDDFGQPQDFRAWFDSQYDERAYLLTIGYSW